MVSWLAGAFCGASLRQALNYCSYQLRLCPEVGTKKNVVYGSFFQPVFLLRNIPNASMCIFGQYKIHYGAAGLRIHWRQVFGARGIFFSLLRTRQNWTLDNHILYIYILPRKLGFTQSNKNEYIWHLLVQAI